MTDTYICELEELDARTRPRASCSTASPIAVVRDSAGAVHALGDTCTHGDISLAEGFVEDDTIECWAHGSKFSLATGKPLTLPAYEPVPVFAVEIIDGAVYIDPNVTVTVKEKKQQHEHTRQSRTSRSPSRPTRAPSTSSRAST